jgi:hypothetical protein
VRLLRSLPGTLDAGKLMEATFHVEISSEFDHVGARVGAFGDAQ